jgi:hypothetical protein
MKKAILALILLTRTLLAYLSTLMTPGDYANEFGGDISIYTRILGMTDCTELKREFERADENAKPL